MKYYKTYYNQSVISNSAIESSSIDLVARQKKEMAKKLMDEIKFKDCNAYIISYKEEKMHKHNINLFSLHEMRTISMMPDGFLKITAKLEVELNA